jgi:hypothetical protein
VAFLGSVKLPDARGDASFDIDVLQCIDVEGSPYAIVQLDIQGVDWPSRELLDINIELTEKVFDHRVVLGQLVLPIESLTNLQDLIAQWIGCGDFFEVTLVDLNFQKLSFKLNYIKESVYEVGHPYVIIDFKGSNFSMSYSMKVDQSCLSCFAKDLNSLALVAK